MNKSLRYIFIVSCAIALAYPLINIYVIFPSFKDLLVENSKDEAVRIANHLAPLVVSDDRALKRAEVFAAALERLEEQFNLEKLKVFSGRGEIIYSSAPDDIGKVNPHRYFHEIVAKGKVYAKVVRKGTKSLEGRTVTADVVETYVPIMPGGTFIGAFEIYYDITERNLALNRVVTRSSLPPLALMFGFLIVILVILFRTDRNLLPSPDTKLKKYQSPFYHVSVVALSLLIAEFVIMLFVSKLHFSSPLAAAVFDSLLLVLLVSPSLYLFLLRPLLLSMEESRQVEAALREKTDKVLAQSDQLQDINLELKALHKVSAAVSRSIDLRKLLFEVLHTITDIEIFSLKRKGVVLLLEGDRLHVGASIGISQALLEAHENMKVGDCLCGRAAASGEVIVSGDCFEDKHHTIRYPGMAPHGHLIVPLKAASGVVGVLCLYLPPQTTAGEGAVNLLLSIGSQIGIAIENAQLYETTRALSLRDPLTGLANRRLLQIETERVFSVARRYKKHLSVIMLDIDHFKVFNDTHGHAEGDKLLIGVATILLREVRDADHAFRYGGEEFLILLPETDLPMAFEVAQRIRRAVEKELEVTLSLGVSTCREAMQNEEELIRSADRALYQAKRRGRNRVEAADSGPG